MIPPIRTGEPWLWPDGLPVAVDPWPRRSHHHGASVICGDACHGMRGLPCPPNCPVGTIRPTYSRPLEPALDRHPFAGIGSGHETGPDQETGSATATGRSRLANAIRALVAVLSRTNQERRYTT